MTIDSTTEHLISLTEAAKELPARRGNKRAHTSTLYRWTTSGCRGVKLEFVQIGGTRCTSHEALSRFYERLTLAAQGQSSDSTVRRTPRQRVADSERAERELDDLGVNSR
jgi:hypothetical protein